MDATSDSTALLIAVATGFLLFAGGFWIIVSLGHWALAPVEHGTAKARVPTQFSLREFALLAIELQLAVGIVFWWCDQSASALWLFAVIAGALLIAWWHGAQRLARCNVLCPMRRGLFLTVVIPLATFSIAAALWINGHAIVQTCLGQHWPLSPWLAGNFVTLTIFLTCRLINVWVLSTVPSGGVSDQRVVDAG